MGQKEFPARKNASISPTVGSSESEKGVTSGSDICQNVAVGFEVVNLMPLRQVQQFDAVAILADPPSPFSVCQIVVHVGFSFFVFGFFFLQALYYIPISLARTIFRVLF
jgi:hypothetical protein